MRTAVRAIAIACCLALGWAGPAVVRADAGISLVVCAPGYPGNTEAAQPTMDTLASTVAASAGWPEGALNAEYHSTLAGGLARLKGDDAALTLVGLPFYLTFREELGLTPLLAVAPAAGDTERFTLVARRGAITGPQSLDGWQVHGMHGYAPRFVKGVVLAGWGRLPATTEIRFTARVVASLRQAANGEPVAVLLDAAQAAALPQLPFADQLETVASSAPMVASVLCSVGGRLKPRARAALLPALTGLNDSEEGRRVLESIRMRAFRPADPAELEKLVSAFSAVPADP